jgi:hypothetical protein
MDYPSQAESQQMKQQPTPYSSVAGPWLGKGSTARLPPQEYWNYLATIMPGDQLQRLHELSDQRKGEFYLHSLGPPDDLAPKLLNLFADDGWVDREERHTCPICEHELKGEEVDVPTCPYCGEIYADRGGVVSETVFIRHLGPTRSVDWVVAIHGMNTSGAWQEAFSWRLSTTWGRSIPVAVYKYGIVITGVLMMWRRRSIQRALRSKLAMLRDQARAQGFSGNPDVIAHSFGTWLFGHIVRDELRRDPKDRLQFGRVVLLGCILRPDFNWKEIIDAGLVEDVLNHYGTADRVVPLAHSVIFDSGPSGKRGFDGGQVLNVRAQGSGHSDLLSVNKSNADGMTNLARSYQSCWKPFLLLPREELISLPDRMNPTMPWKALPLPLRGTAFLLFALPLTATGIALVMIVIGGHLSGFRKLLVEVAVVCAIGLALLLISTVAIELCRSSRDSLSSDKSN